MVKITKTTLYTKPDLQKFIDRIKQTMYKEPEYTGKWYNLSFGNKANQTRRCEIEFTEDDNAYYAWLYIESVDSRKSYYFHICSKNVCSMDKTAYDSALLYTQSQLAHNEEKSTELNNLGVALYDEGNYRNAITNFQKASELDPDSNNLYFSNIAANYQQLKEYSTALEWVNKSLALDRSYEYAKATKGSILDDIRDDLSNTGQTVFGTFVNSGGHTTDAREISEFGKGKITKIITRYGDVIDSLQFHYENGLGAKFGGNGGVEKQVTLNPGEYIRRIELRADKNHIYKIAFYTNQRRDFVFEGNRQEGKTSWHDNGLYLSGIKCYSKQEYGQGVDILPQITGVWFSTAEKIELDNVQSPDSKAKNKIYLNDGTEIDLNKTNPNIKIAEKYLLDHFLPPQNDRDRENIKILIKNGAIKHDKASNSFSNQMREIDSADNNVYNSHQKGAELKYLEDLDKEYKLEDVGEIVDILNRLINDISDIHTGHKMSDDESTNGIVVLIKIADFVKNPGDEKVQILINAIKGMYRVYEDTSNYYMEIKSQNEAIEHIVRVIAGGVNGNNDVVCPTGLISHVLRAAQVVGNKVNMNYTPDAKEIKQAIETNIYDFVYKKLNDNQKEQLKVNQNEKDLSKWGIQAINEFGKILSSVLSCLSQKGEHDDLAVDRLLDNSEVVEATTIQILGEI